jgi:putative Mn2+ efflux pump MntP
MSNIEILILAFALSIDACVVSFSYGLCSYTKKRLIGLSLAITTGFFQMLMPVIGFFFTNIIKTYIQPYAKWIVFIIFAYLGMTFIKESFKEDVAKKPCLHLTTLFCIGIATSIDAFSAGITISLTNTPLIFSIIAIGFVTFLNSIFGFISGYLLKHFNSQALEIISGVLLIALAIKSIL